MATDLNLHRRTATLGQDTQEGRARDKEVHNRERTWLICYILDRSISAQMGKPHSIKEEYVVYLLFWVVPLFSRSVSHIIQNTALFWMKSIALKQDGGIAAYAVRITGQCIYFCSNFVFDRSCNGYCLGVLISFIQVLPRHPVYKPIVIITS